MLTYLSIDWPDAGGVPQVAVYQKNTATQAGDLGGYVCTRVVANQPLRSVDLGALAAGDYDVYISSPAGIRGFTQWALKVVSGIAYIADSWTELDTRLSTSMISPSIITAASVVAPNGSIPEIIIGDDYLAANDRAFEFTVSAPVGLTIGSCICKFGGKGRSGGMWLVTGTLTDVGSGNWKLSFELDSSITEILKPGEYSWSVAVEQASTSITKVRSSGKTTLVVRYT
jgi:hypothetical protein